MADSWQTFAHLYPDQGTGQNNFRERPLHILVGLSGCRNRADGCGWHAGAATEFHAANAGLRFACAQSSQTAEEQFRAAEVLSPAVQSFGLSDVLVVSGKLQEAAQYLDLTNRQAPIFEVERTMRRATLLIAQDDLVAAEAAITSFMPQAERLPSPNPRWRAVAALIALRNARGETSAARNIAAQHLNDLLSAQAQTSLVSLETIEHLLYAASWAARFGMHNEARRALSVARRSGALDRFPVRAQLAKLVAGEIELDAGRPRAAAALVDTKNGGGELWELHGLRARALRALGDGEGHTQELRWLTSHSGLAHAQWIDQFLGQQARAIELREARRQLAPLDLRK